MKRLAFIAHGLHWQRWNESKPCNSLANNYSIQYALTQAPNDAFDFAKQFCVDGFDFIISYGGDGTLHQVVNGMLSIGLQADQLPKLVILPRGSGNDYVRSVPAAKSMEDLAKALTSGHVKAVDVGHITYPESSINHYFINIADAGLGGDVAHRLGHFRIGLSARAMYHWSIIRSLLSYSAREVTVVMDEQEWTGCALSIVVANGKYFGSGLGIAPDADPSDGLFDVVVLGRLSIIEYVTYVKDIRSCKRIHHPEVFYFKSRNVQIQTGSKSLPLECDGEIYPATPVSFACLKQRLHCIVIPNEVDAH